MALISDIVKELATSTNTTEKSITVIARWLREDGLLSQQGRGRGAAQATPLDAARLLIALMIGGKAKNAPQAVRDFGQLVIRHDPVIPGRRHKTSVEELCGLPNGNTFEEGLAVLIEIWGNEDAMRAMRKHRGALTSEPKAEATLNERIVRGDVQIGYVRNYYYHPTVLRWFAGPGKQLDPSGNDSPAAWEKFVARYRSGIDSRKSVDTDLLRPLGEVVADLREPGSGIRDIDAEVRSYG